MDSERFPVSSAEVVTVKKIQFALLSPNQIKAISVLDVKDIGGLSDLSLGTTDKSLRCTTCLATGRFCPGHFGNFKLAKPMFHLCYMKTVLSVLKCVCFFCSRILAKVVDVDNFMEAWEEENPTEVFKAIKNVHKFRQALEIQNPKERFKAMKKVCCDTKCFTEGCPGAVRQPKLTIDDDMRMIARFTGEDPPRRLDADQVLKVLKLISDEDCQRLGFNPNLTRPDWMILQLLPIPPPQVRPSVNCTTMTENDLTVMLSNIIQANENLQKHLVDGFPNFFISKLSDHLQLHINAYFDNNLPGQSRVTAHLNRALESLSCRLKRKEGRVRQNLMGKRVEFSARTVITPDPTINVDEVGVPLTIASHLTCIETVTPLNIERLKELVENGPNPPPGKTGANCIVLEDGRRIKILHNNRFELHLEDGVKVERHLQDGDLVLLNRQPTLHKMSVMGHRIKIMPYSTFRLNMSVTCPYNADFDGDEMTMHVPRSLETATEVSELMMVPACIVSPQASRPVIGIVQDTLLGCRKITKRDTFIEMDMFMNMLMLKKNFDGMIPLPSILKPRPLWTGKQVFSLIIPKWVHILRQSAWHSYGEPEFITPGDTQVRIERGILLTGTLCKKTLGKSTGSLTHVIWEEDGPAAAMEFLANTQLLVNYWLRQHGFTFGIGDIITDSSTKDTIKDTLSGAKADVEDLIQKFKHNKLGPDPGKTMKETFDDKVKQVLVKAHDDAGSIAQNSLAETNNLKEMVTAGSTKGSFMNIYQMTACLGQQSVEGKRIPFEFDRRTLPHFTKGDYRSGSCGFVENSYLSGLTPQEFFFHAIGGREGLIDTAVKIKETGYMQRRLVKAMEDMRVTYDGTVRDEMGNIVQFLYGEDGMDAVYIESLELDLLKMNDLEFESTFKYEIDDENWNPKYPNDQHREELKTREDWRKAVDEEYKHLETDRVQLRKLRNEIATNGDLTWPLPVNIKRLIKIAQDKHQDSLLLTPPVEIIAAVGRLQRRLMVVPGNDVVSTEAQKNATMVFSILLRSTLASKRVLEEYNLSHTSFEWVISQIESVFRQSLVTPGEMVGCIAAQSIGEPVTQMTLRTVHYAGISAENVTTGFPRLRELINVSKEIKTPSISVYLEPEHRMSEEVARTVQVALKGLPGINKVFTKLHEEEWMLVTRGGGSLIAVMCQEYVDPKRTTSNHITEVEEVLGIEAVYRALVDELQAVISFNGTCLNYRHLSILADTMTYRGQLMAITRHGINKSDNGPLMRCSFEETLKVLLDAGCFAQTDMLHGVSGNVMLGQLAPIGTGIFEICPDEDMLNPVEDYPTFPTYVDHNSSPSYTPSWTSPSPSYTPSWTSPSPSYPPSWTSPSSSYTPSWTSPSSSYTPRNSTPLSPRYNWI